MNDTLFGKQEKMFDEIDRKSFDVDQDRVEKLKELFPNIVSDGKVDWKTLKLLLGENVTEEDERYRFTWNGKSKAIRETSIPTSSTLRPCKNEKDSKNWDETENLYIEGDNLEVLKVLQNSYNGKIKMIYIDPPYNTGNDFIYEDDFTLSAEEAEKQEGLKDRKGATQTVDRLTKNSKDSAKYHTNWLNMMYPRLSIARDLLTDDGVIFISIDDNEVHNLRKVCDEIFGKENFISVFIWDGGRKNDSKKVSVGHEYIVTYSKGNNISSEDSTLWRERKAGIDEIYSTYNKLCREYGNDWESINTGLRKWYSSLPENSPSRKHKHYNCADENGIYFASDLSGPDDGRKNRPRYEVLHPKTGKPVTIPSRGWRWEEKRMMEEISKNRVHFGKDEKSIPNGKVYLKENEYQAPSSVFYKDRRSASSELKKLFGRKVFDFPKDTEVLCKLIKLILRDGDIILDFFSGSATTAHSVIKVNKEDSMKRKFIMVQLPEEIDEASAIYKAGFKNICEVGKERIKLAGASIQNEIDNEQLTIDNEKKSLDIGFKTFKIDSSNFNEWDVSYEAMMKSVKNSAEGEFTTYKTDRSHLDLVYEIMLKEGLQLTEGVKEIKVGSDTIYKIADGVMYIYLGKLNNEVIESIVEMKREAQELFGLDNPSVVLNETYLDTEIKSNAKKNFEANGITDIKTL